MESLSQALEAAVPEDLKSDEECACPKAVKAIQSKLSTALTKLRDGDDATLIQLLQHEQDGMRLLLMCGACFGNAHNRDLELRSNSEAVITNILLPAYGCADTKALILKNPQALRRLWDVFKETLRADCWKRFPFHRDACVWALRALTYPELSDHLDVLLPFSLIVVDDYRVDMKLLGIDCLRHIIQHSLKAEMRYSGRADLIYDSLKRLVFTRDSAVLDQAYSCLLELLATFKSIPASSQAQPNSDNLAVTKENEAQRDQYDELCEKLLSDLSVENHTSLMVIFLKHMETFQDVMGAAFTKHTKRFLRCVENCVVDARSIEIRRLMLQRLLRFIQLCRPSARDVAGSVMKYLLGSVIFSEHAGELLVEVAQVISSFPSDLCLVETVLIPLNEEFNNKNVLTLIEMVR